MYLGHLLNNNKEQSLTLDAVRTVGVVDIASPPVGLVNLTQQLLWLIWPVGVVETIAKARATGNSWT